MEYSDRDCMSVTTTKKTKNKKKDQWCDEELYTKRTLLTERRNIIIKTDRSLLSDFMQCLPSMQFSGCLLLSTVVLLFLHGSIVETGKHTGVSHVYVLRKNFHCNVSSV